MSRRLRACLAAAALAVASLGAGACAYISPGGCILVNGADSGVPIPGNWTFHRAPGADVGFWRDGNGTIVGWSRQEDGDIWDSDVCAITNGAHRNRTPTGTTNPNT